MDIPELNLDAGARERCRETVTETAEMDGFSPTIRVWSGTIIKLLDDVEKLINHIKDLEE